MKKAYTGTKFVRNEQCGNGWLNCFV